MSQPRTSFGERSVESLNGVGPRVAEKLARLGIHTLQDVLFHLPHRYEDRTRLIPIGSLRHGDQAVIEGVVDHSEVRFGGRSRRSLLCHVSDGTGSIILRFFHFNRNQQSNLSQGTRIRCFGEVRANKDRIEMAHPEYRRLSGELSTPLEERLTPVYPLTDGVSQGLLRKLSAQVMALLDAELLPELLPESVCNEHGFTSLLEALRYLHQPPADTAVEQMLEMAHPAQRRLIFEELLAHQLSMLGLRTRIKDEAAIPMDRQDAEMEAFHDALGFVLTRAQQRVIGEIIEDISSPVPMMRLVQGDVGSGKTVVAASAMITAVRNGYQVALMAPTEILCEQHAGSFEAWFSRLGIRCALLTGSVKGRLRASMLEAIAAGEIDVVIGTHALFQDDVAFDRLALMVVDEQHRFGVHQRLSLREKGRSEDVAQHLPHQLIMTATPIPRSLTMTLYADLDCSIIDELPAGRRPIQTVVVSDVRRDEVITRISNACRNGEQAYWVCTLIDESEVLQCQAAEATAARLEQELDDLEVGLIHGRMKSAEKEAVMQRFKRGEIDLLVATTVIEVGVDVPEATLMVIENPERLGLAQLHQLRGRVGRGRRESSCVLMYHPPLSAQAKQRLSILRESNDGFVIAEKDLAMRGPGEILGVRQAGEMRFRIADIVRDEPLLPIIRRVADDIMDGSPDVIQPLIERWLARAEKFIAV